MENNDIIKRSKQIDKDNLKEMHEMLIKIINKQKDESKIENGIDYYYKTYESDDTINKVNTFIISMSLKEKKSLLKELAGEIINRDMIYYVQTGENICPGVNDLFKIIT